MKYLSLFIGSFLCIPAYAEINSAESYPLLSRSGIYHFEVPLDKNQRHWLQEKRQLRVGISAPDYPPFDMTTSGQDYEGLTADYIGILGKALNLSIKIQRFSSRDAVIKALEEGQIDVLGTSNGFEAANPKLTLSNPLRNRPASAGDPRAGNPFSHARPCGFALEHGLPLPATG